MKRKWIACCALAGIMTLGACANMSDTERRTATGAAVGAAAVGALTGEWGWAAVGAAAGAAGGYLYDQHKKSEQDSRNK